MKNKERDNFEYLEYLIRESAIGLTEDDIFNLQNVSQSNDPIQSAIDSIEAIINSTDFDSHPFSPCNMKKIDYERPELKLIDLLRRPEYFSFTCSSLFSNNGIEPLRIMPFQGVILKELWTRQFPMLLASRGAGKSFILALYIILRLTFQPGVKIAVVAKSLRQSMIIWEYCARIWHNSPIFRDLVSRGKGPYENGPRRGGNDRCEFRVGESIALFLPLGASGDTIRGIRAQVVIADEFASISEDVYATVVQGFGAVSSDPVAKAENSSRTKILKRMGLWTPEMDADAAASNYGNQSILSGTASYQFNHFYKYWKDYRDTIYSRGDPKKLEEIFKGPPMPGFDHRRYSIIRLPWSKIPHGYMDEATIGRAKQISAKATFMQEYECCFLADSDGFFKQSLIDYCTIGEGEHPLPVYGNPPVSVDFTVAMEGNKTGQVKYVYGVDPAFSRDNFSVVIVEVHPEHRRVVYCWTTNKSDHRKRRNTGNAEFDFYKFCVRKLRSFFSKFPPTEVVIDPGSGGGGQALLEAFSDPGNLETGELPIHQVIDPQEKKDTDSIPGLKLIKLFSFSKKEQVIEANWGLLKDLESRTILFPRINAASYGLAYEKDVSEKRVIVKDEKVLTVNDTLENALYEVEEMKEELSIITHSTTSSGAEKWDVPGAGELGKKKGYVKKDRYSALLMANWAARTLTAPKEFKAPLTIGGFAKDIISRKKADNKSGNGMYITSDKIARKMGFGNSQNYGVVIGHGV